MATTKNPYEIFNTVAGFAHKSTEVVRKKRLIILEDIEAVESIPTPDDSPGSSSSSAQKCLVAFHTHERTTPEGLIEITDDYYMVKTATNQLVNLYPHEGQPHLGGQCFKDHLVSNEELQLCDHPGCGRLVCPLDGVEYRPGKYKCFFHRRIWQVIQALKFIVSPFIRFSR